MTQAKTVLAVLALALAYYYYKFSNVNAHQDSPIVETLAGSVKGIVSLSRNGREFYEYLGIPYAKPPMGELRFESPQPAEKWEGVKDASSYGAICLQTDKANFKIDGSEDCLFLNVFIPKLSNSTKLLPTMVWIHGGMFVYGSSDMYRPEYFMDHDVVLVTMNYRLGSLGFLNTGDTASRGNMALKDQNLALKWVQANIAQFQGNPKQVMIFGESAGGASVHHQVLSPRSKGLFQKAISQSGTAIGLWSTRTDPVKQYKTFSNKLGCPTENTKAAIECLRKINAVTLMEASYDDMMDDLRDPITVFNPSIEDVKDSEAFLIEHPKEILRKGNFNKVPWISGITNEEGLLISAPYLRDSVFTEVSENFKVHLPNMIWHPGNMDEKEIQKIKEFYLGNGKIYGDEKFHNWTNLFTDMAFAPIAQKSIQLQSQHAPVFAYYYSYEGEWSLTDLMFAISGKYPVVLEYMYYFIPRWFNEKFYGIVPHHYGACHFDEVAMFFHMKDLFYIGKFDKDYPMSRAAVKAWVEFASNPDSQSLQFDGVTWPQVDPKGKKPLQYMHIDIKSSIIDEPNAERNAFWNSLKL